MSTREGEKLEEKSRVLEDKQEFAQVEGSRWRAQSPTKSPRERRGTMFTFKIFILTFFMIPK
jgi:hypothetical protein